MFSNAFMTPSSLMLSSLKAKSQARVVATSPAPVATSSEAKYDLMYYLKGALAGGICCSITHGALTPVDVVKTRIQLEPEVYNRGMIGGFQQVIANEGASALLTGLGPTVSGYFIQGWFKFGGVEFFKINAAQSLGPQAAWDNRVGIYLGASACAEFIADIFLCPLEATRIRLVSEPTFASSMPGAFARLLKEEGLIKGFYSGFGPICLKQIPYTMAKFAVQGVAAESLSKTFGINPETASGASKTFLALGSGTIAGVAAAIISHPADTLLSKVNKAGAGGEGSIMVRLGRIAAETGIWNLCTQGLGARCVMIGTLTAGQFAIFDTVMSTLGAKKFVSTATPRRRRRDRRRRSPRKPPVPSKPANAGPATPPPRSTSTRLASTNYRAGRPAAADPPPPPAAPFGRLARDRNESTLFNEGASAPPPCAARRSATAPPPPPPLPPRRPRGRCRPGAPAGRPAPPAIPPRPLEPLKRPRGTARQRPVSRRGPAVSMLQEHRGGTSPRGDDASAERKCQDGPRAIGGTVTPREACPILWPRSSFRPTSPVFLLLSRTSLFAQQQNTRRNPAYLPRGSAPGAPPGCPALPCTCPPTPRALARRAAEQRMIGASSLPIWRAADAKGDAVPNASRKPSSKILLDVKGAAGAPARSAADAGAPASPALSASQVERGASWRAGAAAAAAAAPRSSPGSGSPWADGEAESPRKGGDAAVYGGDLASPPAPSFAGFGGGVSPAVSSPASPASASNGRNSSNLIVNYLPNDCSEDELRSLFEAHGPVESVKVVTDRATGLSCGYGFVKFSSESSAVNAIEGMQGLPLRGKRLKVSVALGPGRGGGLEGLPRNNLIVNYLTHDMDEDALLRLFSQHGDVESVKVVRDKETHKSQCYGFVKFCSDEAAESALAALNGLPVGSKRLKVSVARPAGGEARHNKLYVSYVPKSYSEEDVCRLFQRFGRVLECRLLYHDSGESRCTAFVHMATRQAAAGALVMHGVQLQGASRGMVVKMAHARSHRLGPPAPAEPLPLAPGLRPAPQMQDHMALGIAAQSSFRARAAPQVWAPGEGAYMGYAQWPQAQMPFAGEGRRRLQMPAPMPFAYGGVEAPMEHGGTWVGPPAPSGMLPQSVFPHMPHYMQDAESAFHQQRRLQQLQQLQHMGPRLAAEEGEQEAQDV